VKAVEVRAATGVVWRALAEAEELKRWFPVDARVTAGPGGSIWLSWGPETEGTGAITAWEPGRRLGWEEDRRVARIAVDFHLEATGGRTIVRVVQSGFGGGPEWDDEFHMTDGGWSYFLAHLKWYLERHRGTPRDLVSLREQVALSRPVAFSRLERALAGVGSQPLVESRATQQLGVTVPDLNDAILFVEVEPAPTGSRPGLWLSTYGLPAGRLEAARREFSALYRRALAESTSTGAAD
jgi:uncharacterized protein YndB with AHSA1/START domain